MNFQKQHWYDREGQSAHGAGLRDARKNGYVPSVTTIERVIAAPALVNWKVEQALDAALTLPRRDGESLDAFKERARADSERQAREAAAKGSALHNRLERCFKSGAWPNSDGPFEAHAAAVMDALLDRWPDTKDWVAEASFSHPIGFGGRVDLRAPGIVVDFKSKPRIEDGKKYAHDNHARQLAAYAVGLGVVSYPEGGVFDWNTVILCNLFIGIEDAKVEVHIWKPEMAARGWRQFRAALDLWKALNNFDPAY